MEFMSVVLFAVVASCNCSLRAVITAMMVFIWLRKHLSALMSRHSRSRINGIIEAGVGTRRQGTRSVAALMKSSITLGDGNGSPLMTSISGCSSFNTFSRHSIDARSGAIWSIRLNVIAQSVGIPFDMSENAESDPPVGNCTFAGLGDGIPMSAHLGRLN